MNILLIDAPHFYAGAIVVKERITEAAPIINYMIGWKITQVYSYCAEKKWKLIESPIKEALIEF